MMCNKSFADGYGHIPIHGTSAAHCKEQLVQVHELDNRPRLNTSSYVNVVFEQEEEVGTVIIKKSLIIERIGNNIILRSPITDKRKKYIFRSLTFAFYRDYILLLLLLLLLLFLLLLIDPHIGHRNHGYEC